MIELRVYMVDGTVRVSQPKDPVDFQTLARRLVLSGYTHVDGELAEFFPPHQISKAEYEYFKEAP